jgi:hypothetical protein
MTATPSPSPGSTPPATTAPDDSIAPAGGVVRRLRARFVQAGPSDRGDVPGWVLVTLMTAGLVVTLWAVAGPRLAEVFESSIDSVQGPG